MMKKIAVGSTALLMTGLALAIDTQVPLAVASLPMEDGGMFALAAACLAIGIRVVRRKQAK